MEGHQLYQLYLASFNSDDILCCCFLSLLKVLTALPFAIAFVDMMHDNLRNWNYPLPTTICGEYML